MTTSIASTPDADTLRDGPSLALLVREYNDVLGVIDNEPLVQLAIGALHAARAMLGDAPLWEPGLHPRGSTEGWAWAATARMQLSLALSLHTAARAHADVVGFPVPQ